MEKQKIMAKGYSDGGASLTKRALKGFQPNSGSPAEDINFNNRILRQRSRMLYMSSPIATSAINVNRTKVVGTGLTLKATVDREYLGMSVDAVSAWQKRVESEFLLWAGKKQNCDAIGMNNFLGLQQLAMKSWLMSGDVFALLRHEEPTRTNPYGLRIQLIEADRICNPSQYVGEYIGAYPAAKIPDGEAGAGHFLYDGVEVDENGRVVAYHICNHYPQEFRMADTVWTRVPVYGEETGLPNILHIVSAERPDQYRGVPYLAQVVEPLLQVKRYTESELMGALIQSFFTAWIKTKSSTSENPLNEVGAGDLVGFPTMNPTEQEVSKSENEYEMGPGVVIHLDEDEDVVFGDPKIPTAGFEVFLSTVCKEVGAALEIPSEVLLKTFNSSYSASRAALMEAWEAFKMRRTWFVDSFCQPIYEVWLAEAVARGRVLASGYFDDAGIRQAWCGARWIGPVQGQLDPKKEASAQIMLAQSGVKTYEQITREMGGGDWNENAEQLKSENALLADAKAEIAEVMNNGEE